MSLSKKETIMKKQLIILAFIALFLGGCEDFLNVKPIGQPTTDSFLSDPAQTEASIEIMLRAAYSIFTAAEQTWRANVHYFENFLPNCIADDSQKGGNGISDIPEMLNPRSWTCIASASLSSHFETPWVVGYLGVARANNVLQQLDLYKANVSQQYYDRVRGECLFIRAYFYFLLEKNFGSFPYYTEPVTANQYFDQVKEKPEVIYANIEADLRECITLVPEKSGFADAGIWWGGRGSKGAARALLARVLTMEIGFGMNGKTWQEVYDITEDIINSGEYSLVPNYAMVWEDEGEMSDEAVFETPCADIGQGYGQPGGNMEQRMTTFRPDANLIYGDNTTIRGGGWGFETPTQNLFDQFTVGDHRREITMVSDGNINFGEVMPVTVSDICPTGHWYRKYQGPNPRHNTSGEKNYRVIRYSEVLLTYAEAASHIGNDAEALDKLNMVRERAMNSSGPKGSVLGDETLYPTSNGLPDGTPTVASTLQLVPNTTGAALLDSIKHERRVELAVEGNRLYDLYRWGEFEDALRHNGIVTDDRYIGTMDPEDVVANYESHTMNKEGVHTGGAEDVIPVLPIPVDEVENFRLEQNPGY
jgi:starch-binding outer membrane protein, SusD/RagB family